MDLLNLWKLEKYRCEHDAPIVMMKTSFQKERFANFKKITKTTLNCAIKVECEICPNGEKIPNKYTDKRRKLYLYDSIKAKIINPDPEKLMQRIYGIK